MVGENPSGQRRLAVAATLLIASVGLPLTALKLFEPEAKAHPGRSIFLFILWELSLLLVRLLVRFTSKVWQELEGVWVKKLASSINAEIERRFSGYRRSYLEWIFFQTRDVDVKGLSAQGAFSLELGQVFVDLAVEPRAVSTVSTNIIRPASAEPSGRKSIWDYLQPGTEVGHLMILGTPGSGKTTLLKKIALHLTQRNQSQVRADLPILLALREQSDRIHATPGISLERLLEDTLSDKQGPIPPSGWFSRHLSRGRCLILLDGLDEVPAEEGRREVVSWVERQILSQAKNFFIITSRPHGYPKNEITGITTLEIQPFNREQIKSFVRKWYLANEVRFSAAGKLDAGVEAKARGGAENLLGRLGNSQILTELAVNPLLLTMIATIHRSGSALPGRRVELYREIFEVFLSKRPVSRGIESNLTPAQKQRVLQPLAYHLMTVNKLELPEGEAAKIVSVPLRRVGYKGRDGAEIEFLRSIRDQSGLILERRIGFIGFTHRAFQEFLAAVYAAEEGLGQELVKRISDPWWQEVIRLFGANSDASLILSACFANEHISIENLTLAIDCIDEAREADPHWRETVNTFIAEGEESSDAEKFKLAAETLLARRIRNMVAVGEGVFVDTGYITNAEYQLFLDQKLQQGKYRQPDHWQDLRFSRGTAALPILGLRPSDGESFCAWLSARVGASRFRLPMAEELDHYGLGHIAEGKPHGYWARKGEELIFEAPADLSGQHVSGLPMEYLDFKRWLSIPKGVSSISTEDPLLKKDIRDAKIISRDLSSAESTEYLIDLRKELRLDSLAKFSEALDLTGHSRSEVVTMRIFDPLEVDRQIAFDNAFDVAIKLDRSLQRLLDRSVRFKLSADASEMFRWLARVFAFDLLVHAERIRPFPDVAKRQWSRTLTIGQWADKVKEQALSTCSSLVLLESRILGGLSPLEGLRLIREGRG